MTEIKNVMTSVRRNETCRVKKERVLMDAYQLLNGDDDKTCACPADNNRARPTEKWVFLLGNFSQLIILIIISLYIQTSTGTPN